MKEGERGWLELGEGTENCVDGRELVGGTGHGDVLVFKKFLVQKLKKSFLLLRRTPQMVRVRESWSRR